MVAPAPVPGKFDEDPRVSFDKTVGKWQYEDEDTGQEFEWNGTAWIALVRPELTCGIDDRSRTNNGRLSSPPTPSLESTSP